MKKIIILLITVFAVCSVQAQETIKTYDFRKQKVLFLDGLSSVVNIKSTKDSVVTVKIITDTTEFAKTRGIIAYRDKIDPYVLEASSGESGMTLTPAPRRESDWQYSISIFSSKKKRIEKIRHEITVPDFVRLIIKSEKGDISINGNFASVLAETESSDITVTVPKEDIRFLTAKASNSDRIDIRGLDGKKQSHPMLEINLNDESFETSGIQNYWGTGTGVYSITSERGDITVKLTN